MASSGGGGKPIGQLSDLPPPPTNKTGWPWTEESPAFPRTMVDGSPWPKISIVTPSYNQGQFLEETIRSVILQGYPNLEYFVIDGGSTDDSVKILRHYDPWITHWISQPDRGQAHALNIGFAQCTGELLGWINSDDLLLPAALNHLAVAFKQHPTAIILGNVVNLDEIREYRWEMAQRDVTFEKISQPWRYGVTWHQPGTYFPRTLYERVGPLDETLRYVFDWDWMCRALQLASSHYLRWPVALFRYHDTSKTVSNASAQFAEKPLVAAKRYWPESLATNPQLAEATMQILLAETYFTIHNRDSRKGFHYLSTAFALDYRVLKWPRYWLLWLKGLIPHQVLHFIRVLLKGA